MRPQFETLFTGIICTVWAGVIVHFMVSGQVHGADAWYYTMVALHNNTLLANLMALGLLAFVFGMFSLVPGKRARWWFVPALFLSGLYAVRFITPEINDFVMYALGFGLITVLKVNPIGPLNHRAAGYGLALAYGIFHSVFIWPPLAPDVITGTAELIRTWSVLWVIFPALYILAINKQRMDTAAVAALAVLLPVVKFVVTALPFPIFAAFLDLTERRNIQYSRIILIVFVVAAAAAAWAAAGWVDMNQEAEAEYCDKDTMICDNHEYGTQFYGHYFASLGYLSTGQREFGVCLCRGVECVKLLEGDGGSLECGERIHEQR